MGDDIKDVANKGLEGAKDLGNKIKDGATDLANKLNGANMVQLSSMGLFMTVLAIFNR